MILLNANVALATPAFVQANYAAPQLPQSSVTALYPGAQAAGDLNVVVIGWGDTLAQITSVTDSAGNSYYLAAGPTLLSVLASQSIYYAQNVVSSPSAGNAVTVTFSAPAVYPDIRILEYSGIDQNNPLDGWSNASSLGGTTTTSGAVGTTSATDLLVAANVVQTLTTDADDGFALRILTKPDGDIVEDSLTTATGSYSASAPLSNPG